MTTSFGAQSAWRQLVDLIGRRRVPADAKAIARLESIRALVPPPVRAASARALASANPPMALVRLFAHDELPISAPVLRSAQLRSDEWITLLPGMSPSGRSVLRHRRDLSPQVRRALESYGSVDFRLPGIVAAEARAMPLPVAEPVVDAAEPLVWADDVTDQPVAPTWPAFVDAVEPTPAAILEPAAEPAAEPIVAEVAEIGAPIAAVESVAEQPAVEADAIAVDWTDVLGAEALAAEPTAVAPATVEPEAALAEAVEPEVVEPEPVAVEVIEPDVIEAATPAEAAAGAAIEFGPVESVAREVATTDTQDGSDEVNPAPMPVLTSDTAFVSLGAVALGLPVVAEALRRAGDEPTGTAPAEEIAPVAEDMATVAEQPAVPIVEAFVAPVVEAAAPIAEVAPPATDAPTEGPFQISELVARIDAYQRQREEAPAVPLLHSDSEAQPALFDLEPVQSPSFRFETDAAGIVRWIEGAARAPLIGLSLDLAAMPAGSRVDGVAAGAFRRRAGFANARLVVDGQSDAAGQWRITGIPVFDRESGRFTGYRGTARRPRADESAEPVRGSRNPQTDALRQLVHELRTPTNAISGFAEMIETQLLGPVPQAYRDHAGAIRGQARDLLTAIDDIDMAARIESDALDLRPGVVAVAPLLAQVAGDLAPLAGLRGTVLTIDPGAFDMAIAGDDRAVERLIARLMATLVASGSQDETINVAARIADPDVLIEFDRPRALAAYGNEAILTIDAEAESEAEGAPLLGTGFALRLARNLATELGGALVIGEQALTLRLPAAVIKAVEQVSSS